MSPASSDELEDRLCVALRQTSHAMTAAYRKLLQPLGLTYPQYTVLSALWESSTATMKTLGDLLGSDYGTISPLVQRLEAMALVRRTRSTDDERQVVIQLTDDGRRLRETSDHVQSEIREAAGLTDIERAALVGALRQLTARLHRFARPTVIGDGHVTGD